MNVDQVRTTSWLLTSNPVRLDLIYSLPSSTSTAILNFFGAESPTADWLNPPRRSAELVCRSAQLSARADLLSSSRRCWPSLPVYTHLTTKLEPLLLLHRCASLLKLGCCLFPWPNDCGATAGRLEVFNTWFCMVLSASAGQRDLEIAQDAARAA